MTIQISTTGSTISSAQVPCLIDALSMHQGAPMRAGSREGRRTTRQALGGCSRS